MPATIQARCPECLKVTPHVTEGTAEDITGVTMQPMKCSVCGREWELVQRPMKPEKPVA